MTHRSRLAVLFTVSAVVANVVGCGSPNKANIALRKENQSLSDKIALLERQHQVDVAALETAIAANAAAGSPTTRPVADPARVHELFLPVGLKLGRLTAVTNLDYRTPAVNGLKVQVSPTDDTGDVIKATGTIVVEATDPLQSPEPLLGRWEFAPADLKKLWYSTTFTYAYVLPCPWQSAPPQTKSIRVKVRFVDLLTGRTIGPVETVVPNAPVAHKDINQ
jgi:hypothetical protein